MIASWQTGLLIFLKTTSEILTAGIAITAFSLLLYSLSFNLQDRVARSFALILICVVVVFTAEAFGSTSSTYWEIDFWLRLQWVGIVLLPATYLHFSDALLATTGKPSRWRRVWAVRVTYFLCLLFLASLPFDILVGRLVMDQPPAPYLQPTLATDVFIIFYAVVMILSWYNFARAYRRTTTSTSRRRMAYLITSALAPAVGSFPYLLFGSTFAARHSLIFWGVAVLINLVVGVLVVVMAYSVAFFGVPWPDRVVKSRLFKWIMRGPVTASFTLALTTIVRRTGEAFGYRYSALVPIVMVGTILLIEHIITIFSPLWEKWLFYNNDRHDLELVRKLEERLITRNDLQQFLEMVLAAICDRLQAPGAYLAVLNAEKADLLVTTGKASITEPDVSDQLNQLVLKNNGFSGLFRWGNDYLVQLVDESSDQERTLLGLLGISGVEMLRIDEEQAQALEVLSERAAKTLRDYQAQRQIFSSLQLLAPEMDYIERVRAAGRYDGSSLLMDEEQVPPKDMLQWVKEALTHYWGGPKLTQNPLMQFKIVQDLMSHYGGSQANALRAILREAIEKVRPEGDRRFTAEWILYNILEMKFLEGKKVREVALRLAMSEADLYRKQRIAIEAVAKAILEMEADAQVHSTN